MSRLPLNFLFPVFPCLAVTQGPAFDTVFMTRIDTYLVLWATGNPSLQSQSYAGDGVSTRRVSRETSTAAPRSVS